MRIKKRCFVRTLSFLFAAVLVMGGFALTEYNRRIYLKGQIENSYKQSLSEFSSLISEINFGLKKQLYSSSPALCSTLSADVYKNSSAAKECLERLPVSPENTENIYKFLATAGDFSRAVSVSDSDGISNDNKKQLKQLINYSEKLNNEISSTALNYEDSDLISEDVNNMMNKIDSKTTFSASAEDINEATGDFPTLIYDGPFSDHISKKEPALLKDEATISKDAALKKAQTYLNEQNLKYTCDENSVTESYIFEGKNSVCAVTKRGGYCLYMNKSQTPKNAYVTTDKAISTAKDYLKKITGLIFKESYYIISENVITINFAYTENEIIFYPDLIKVGINLDNGEVISVEARGFVMNHYNRSPENYTNTAAQAQEVLGNELKVESCFKALIADDALNEMYCYEFKCKTDDSDDIIVYVNQKTLKEENIFILIHTDGGTLTK